MTGVKARLSNDAGHAIVTMVTQVVEHAVFSFVSEAWRSCVNADMARTTGRAEASGDELVADVDYGDVIVVSIEYANVGCGK